MINRKVSSDGYIINEELELDQEILFLGDIIIDKIELVQLKRNSLLMKKERGTSNF